MKNLFLTLAVIAFSIQTADAQWWSNKKVNGNGNMVSETRNTGTYDQVSLEGNMDVELIAGKEGQLTVEAESNLMEYILTEVSGGKLKISVEKGINLNPSRNEGIRILVPFETLNRLSVTGSGDMYTSDKITADAFDLRLTGSGDMKIHLESESVTAKITGSGDVALRGKTNDFECTVTGSGDFEAYDFQARSANASVMGSGDIQLQVTGDLKARVAGSGDIRYRGNPEKEDFKTTGSGAVSKN